MGFSGASHEDFCNIRVRFINITNEPGIAIFTISLPDIKAIKFLFTCMLFPLFWSVI